MACFDLFWASTSSLLKPGTPVMLPQIRASHSSHENLHRNAEMPGLAKKAAMRWESLLRALSMLNSARRCRWQRFRVVQRSYVFSVHQWTVGCTWNMYCRGLLQNQKNQEWQRKQKSKNCPTSPSCGGDTGLLSEAVNSAIRELCSPSHRTVGLKH